MDHETKICVRGLNLYYGSNHALKNINMDIPAGAVTAFIGPSGCGKSTFLKTLNRMNDLVPGVRIEGEVLLDGQEIYGPNVDTIALRQKVGMVFQQPNPFPMSIYDNVAYGPRVHGIRGKERLDDIVEESLQGAAIWKAWPSGMRSKIRLIAARFPFLVVSSSGFALPGPWRSSRRYC